MSKVGNAIMTALYAAPDQDAKAVLATLTEQGIETTESSVQSHRTHFIAALNFLKSVAPAPADGTEGEPSVEAAAAAVATAPKKGAKGAKPKKQTRAARWSDACSRATDALGDLKALQEEYESWKESLPENLQSTPVGEKLEAVCDLGIEDVISEIEEFEGTDLPLGFGRD
jgi:hypothetical protein